MSRNLPSYNKGFTLIELAVVLVIVALVAGGIVMAREMIRNAQMQQALAEYDRYVKAVGEFQEKYNQLPGDFTGATTMWGSDTCPTNAVSSPKRETCNGNGSGQIGTSDDDGNTDPDHEEWWRAWQHLANSGLIEGLYSGTEGSGGSMEATVGTNVPASKVPSAGWTLLYYLNVTTDASLWGDTYGHVLYFGASTAGGGKPTKGTAITPAEALGIDQKMDDGYPGTGKIRAWRSGAMANCTENDTAQTSATYKTSNSNMVCSLIFIPGF